MKIPEKKPAVVVDIPKSWKPEPTDEGIACESPDQVATVFFEVTSAKGVDKLIDDNIDWLTKEQSVKIDKATQKTSDYETGSMKWSRISWDGSSKEWGPSVVGFMFTPVGKDKVLTVTYWITKKDKEKHAATLEKIFASVKRVEE